MSIYRSNLTAPDLTPWFRYLHSRPLGHSFGHDVPSDWSDKADDDPTFGMYKRCGMWTHDEAAILYRIAESSGHELDAPLWLDLGAHTGWTSGHLCAASCKVIAVEPMLLVSGWYQRLADNVGVEMKRGWLMPWAGRSDQFFDQLRDCPEPRFDGVVIDGDHDAPRPLLDALHAHHRLKRHGVIVLHDLMGAPVQRAAMTLVQQCGYRMRVFFSPHMIACCWRGGWTPPEHVPDPAIDWQEIRSNHMKDFDWSKAE